jgi:predicted Fe-S protein YdhL (DUF1289 family)
MNQTLLLPDTKVTTAESPCNKNCTISSKTGYCDGCGMSLKEMVDWETSTDSEKKLLIDIIKKRQK